MTRTPTRADPQRRSNMSTDTPRDIDDETRVHAVAPAEGDDDAQDSDAVDPRHHATAPAEGEDVDG
jgi:hypothetical protein